MSWPKVEFDAWWRETWTDYEPTAIDPGALYDLGVYIENPQVANAWTPTAIDANTPLGRHLHTAVWTGSEMLIFGGQFSQGAFWTGTEMWVWGGWNNGEIGTGGKYNVASDSWTVTPTSGAPSPRRYHAATWTSFGMVVWGGWDGTEYLGDGARLNGSWSAIPSSSGSVTAPSPRAGHTATLFSDNNNTSVVIWGGHDDGGALADGRRLNSFLGRARVTGRTVSLRAVDTTPATTPGNRSHLSARRRLVGATARCGPEEP